MLKNINKIYIIQIGIIGLFLLFCFFVLPNFINYYQIFLTLYFGIIFLIFKFSFGIPRDRKVLNKICFRYVFVILLSYIIVIYMLGLFTGFTTNVYSLRIFDVIKNILPIIFFVIFRELIRHIIAFQSKKKIGPIIILTIIYIIIDILPMILLTKFTNHYNVFTFITVYCIELIGREVLSSYLVYYTGIYPSLLYNIIFAIAPYILPIYPNLGNYLNAILGLLLPFIIYIIIKKWINYNTKETKGFVIVKIIGIPILIFSLLIVILTSGVFKYQLIAIASDSMNPIYYRGDAVIYEKVNVGEIKEGDILVFTKNSSIITHRVIKVIDDNDNLKFQTKGDNNENVDFDYTDENQVLGIVKYIVKYVGLPTIWFNETF